MLMVMPPLSASHRGHCAIRRSSIDPNEIEMRIAAIMVLQRQDELDDKSDGSTNATRGVPSSYTGRVVPHFPGQYCQDPLTSSSKSAAETNPTVHTSDSDHLNPPAPVMEAQMMQLHAMKHYPLIDQHYFSQQECYLNKTLLKWEFDVLKFEESSAQGVLKDVCMKLVELHGLIEEFQLSLVSLLETFQLIQASYHNNPYHNAAHAADVVQAACCLIGEQKIKKHMTRLEHLAMIMAGSCHDLDHPGVNQAFLKTTNHYLTEAARRYPKPSQYRTASSKEIVEESVTSVLEIHHIRHAAAIFDQTRVFSHFSDDQYMELLRLIRELILATDMAYQGKYMEKLKRMNAEYAALKTEEERDAFFENEEKRRFYLQISLKCADICNTCRPWHVSQKWSRRVTEEFFAQGDKERVLSLPINEINDRTRTTIEKVQVGFLKFVARPLFSEWDSIHKSSLSQSLLDYIDDNLAKWSIVQKQQEERAAAATVIPLAASTTASSQSVNSSASTSNRTAPPVLGIPQSPKPDTLSLVQQHPTKSPANVQAENSNVDVVTHHEGRKRSIPCAFVSLDHSVAIINDNLRMHAAAAKDNQETSEGFISGSNSPMLRKTFKDDSLNTTKHIYDLNSHGGATTLEYYDRVPLFDDIQNSTYSACSPPIYSGNETYQPKLRPHSEMLDSIPSSREFGLYRQTTSNSKEAPSPSIVNSYLLSTSNYRFMPNSNLSITNTSPPKNDNQPQQKEAELNAYAKLTSPPPYRKSIMITVDKSQQERLRASYVRALENASPAVVSDRMAALNSVKASQVTLAHKPQTNRSVQLNVSTEAVSGDSSGATSQNKNLDEQELQRGASDTTVDGSGGGGHGRPPRRTTSAKSENILLPSSHSPSFHHATMPAHGYSSGSILGPSPEMSRSKINQSRNNFFQSLLPASFVFSSKNSPLLSNATANLSHSQSPATSPRGTDGQFFHNEQDGSNHSAHHPSNNNCSNSTAVNTLKLAASPPPKVKNTESKLTQEEEIQNKKQRNVSPVVAIEGGGKSPKAQSAASGGAVASTPASSGSGHEHDYDVILETKTIANDISQQSPQALDSHLRFVNLLNSSQEHLHHDCETSQNVHLPPTSPTSITHEVATEGKVEEHRRPSRCDLPKKSRSILRPSKNRSSSAAATTSTATSTNRITKRIHKFFGGGAAAAAANNVHNEQCVKHNCTDLVHNCGSNAASNKHNQK